MKPKGKPRILASASLLRRLEGPDAIDAWEAARGLSLASPEGVSRRLVRALHNGKEVHTRRAAAWLLGSLGEGRPATVRALMASVDGHPSPLRPGGLSHESGDGRRQENATPEEERQWLTRRRRKTPGKTYFIKEQVEENGQQTWRTVGRVFIPDGKPSGSVYLGEGEGQVRYALFPQTARRPAAAPAPAKAAQG
jgi:hypothetical protein